MLCTMEMWERLAYYGMRVVVPIYIAQADEPDGLHFSQTDKGIIFAWWAAFQSILPTFTGGFADRYGYKQTIFWSVNLKVLGYVLMATQRSFWGFFIGCMVLATGTAIFKPGLQGAIAHTLDSKSASKGWGIFYWLVNVGAAIGPPLAGFLRKMSWEGVFYGCALIVSLNYLMMFTYKDPKSGADATQSPWKVFQVTISNLLDRRLIAFLTILSGFWLMMYQLWDLHPNFITDWIDSSAIASLSLIPQAWTAAAKDGRGVQVLQENLLNLNAALIVVFIVPISIMVAKLRTLSAMVGGSAVAIMGVIVAGTTQSGWMFLLGIVFFSFGEMLTGPKKIQYLAEIAPPEKKGLYTGYVNVPVGVGWMVGSLITGFLYGNYGEKAVLAQKYLAEKTDWLKAKNLGAWNGQVADLGKALGVERPEAFQTLVEYTGNDPVAMTNILWDTYQPYVVWYPIAAIGLVSTIALVVFAQMAKRWNDMNK
jgi:MFS family permease